RRRDALAAEKRAVLADERLEHGSFRRHQEPRVPAGHGRLVEPDLHIGIATDYVLTDREWQPTSVPLEPARGTCQGLVARPGYLGIGAKRVAKSMRRSNVHRCPRGVAECFPKFSHEVGEIRLGDERGRPETFLQL